MPGYGCAGASSLADPVVLALKPPLFLFLRLCAVFVCQLKVALAASRRQGDERGALVPPRLARARWGRHRLEFFWTGPTAMKICLIRAGKILQVLYWPHLPQTRLGATNPRLKIVSSAPASFFSSVDRILAPSLTNIGDYRAGNYPTLAVDL